MVVVVAHSSFGHREDVAAIEGSRAPPALLSRSDAPECRRICVLPPRHSRRARHECMRMCAVWNVDRQPADMAYDGLFTTLSLALSMSWRYGTISDAGAGGYLLFDDDDDDDEVEEVERGRCEEGTS